MKFTLSMMLLPLILISPMSWYNLVIMYTLFLMILVIQGYTPMMNIIFINNWLLMDTLSWALLLLTAWISLLSILASQSIQQMKKSNTLFMIMSILLFLSLSLCFLSKSLILFYIFFEIALIPTLLLILIWGYQPERLQAGLYLMLYTISASLPLLAGILLLININGHTNMTMLSTMPALDSALMKVWSAQLSLAFLVKLPLYMTHLWLPKAHVEAPVAGSMILAGILLKLGVYGLLRITSIFPKIISSLCPIILPVSLIGATITSLICLRQTDFKSLIAYSSVGHMGLLAGGLFSGNTWGWQGALLMSIAHGLCSSALFALANMLYSSTQSRSLFLIKGLQSYFPTMTFWWFLFCICNMAAPPSLNLLSEILLMTSILATSYMSLLPLMGISFFSAAYSLFLYVSTQHGLPSKQMNPLLLCPSNNYSTLILHLFPLMMAITMPMILTNWM
uniref:NADH-ubiquinone oxidoreductase chain 4 n=1 Tax=Phascolosoma esculenta TaxID=419950 RepID=C3PUI7_9ANNE|nr:NADH dehydrogenase subunit 4 [Phascolosoma esculenta]ABQ52603.1 NADH dehydrogenase subunit 4 [Phascolosoma esculenta]